MTCPNTKNKSDRCECGDPVPHPPEAHTDLVAAIAAMREAMAAAMRWMAVVRRLAGREGR